MPLPNLPLNLAEICRPLFSATIRERGNTYFLEDRVDLQEVGDDSARAHVRGSGPGRPYATSIGWHDLAAGSLYTRCDCPYFDLPDRLCKHLWALILELDNLEDADGLGLADVHDSSTRYTGGLPADPAGGPGPLPTYPSIDSWQNRLREVWEIAQPAQSHTAAPRRAWFVLEGKHRPPHQSRLRISFYRQDALKKGGHGKLKPSPLNKAEIPRFETKDQDLLRLLLGFGEGDWEGLASGSSIYDHDPRRSSVTIPLGLFDVLLPRLCGTGRFGWLVNDPDRRCQALALDAEPPWRLRLDAELRDTTVALQGNLVREQPLPVGDPAEIETGIEPEPVEVEMVETDDPGSEENRAAGMAPVAIPETTVIDATRVDLEVVELSKPIALYRSGWIFFDQRVGRLAHAAEHFPWILSLRGKDTISIPRQDLPVALEEMGRIPNLPELRLPESLEWSTITLEPEPCVMLIFDSGDVVGRPVFVYGERRFDPEDTTTVWADMEGQRMVQRGFESERAHLRKLAETLIPQGWTTLRVPVNAFLPLAQALVELGWRLETEGHEVRTSGSFSAKVKSGIDWFELSGAVDFGDQRLELPELLTAIREGNRFVRLDDGSVGLLAESWLERFAPLAQLTPASSKGTGKKKATDEDGLRFEAHQALVLDALLAAEPRVEVDAIFDRIRKQLHSFEGLEPTSAPETFRGSLRPYQESGLAWLSWLRDLRLGGCLADDMGLGKTIQVLALLEQRRLQVQRAERPTQDGPDESPSSTLPRPSLLVVPRSLLHNWMSEAERFTPGLSMHLYHGPRRKEDLPTLHASQQPPVIVTTYGTLRRDLMEMRTFEFDLLVLDEAQAIKNSSSQTAKACRLLRATQRLALTGTPVENHLGELWSLFEFLNPGMLGRLPALASMAGKSQLPHESLAVIAKAIRPLVLRRTKGEVLADLPAKTEQTLHCELSSRERERYDELLDHYRALLTTKVRDVGLGRSKIQVLEALLRLRQAACHGGLLDPDRQGESSAKLEVLLERLAEVRDEGDKALVFSQFTKMLAIVRDRLDRDGVPYEYLDGRTRDRQARVDRFQSDPECPIFLISLKAGGVGLNLTAASYVFLLDPWWNPAVESQAIDRTHRIGQEKPVFAYRLIARDTVEEKILELQESKRALADAIVSQDRRLLRQLTADDLALLLGGPLDRG